jgi:hypothetical protein
VLQPQLQAGHWYLVYAESGGGSIRAYMADGGWYPAHPRPVGVTCEMSRTHHPDNVEIGDDIVVTGWDQIVIDSQYPLAADEPLVARAIRAMAERICVAAGKEWDRHWTWDQDTEPEIMKNRHVQYLMIACDLVKQVGENPQIRDWDEVLATHGPPEGIFRPRRWPADAVPGALQLLSRAS